MSLRDLSLQMAYHKGHDDIARDFYLPCMDASIAYDRAVGYFSSTIFIIAWSSLKEFVKRGGKIRIICSPILSKDDKEALDSGYSLQKEENLGSLLAANIEEMFEIPSIKKPAKILASLVALGIIDFKIAYFDINTSPRHKRIFHEKIGIFQDFNKNCVVFKGSMNETFAGLSSDGNLESIDVFVTWEGEKERQRVAAEREHFEKLWDNDYSGVIVRPFPDVAKEILLHRSDVKGWEALIDEVTKEIALLQTLSAERGPKARTPRQHQLNALLSWFEKDRKGIFEHATGSGKTFTALCAIRNSLERGEVVIVLVPSTLLLEQWVTEIKESFTDLEPRLLLCGGGHTTWKDKRLLRPMTKKNPKPAIIISTIQTASTDLFFQGLVQGNHLFLVIDEVHRVGSPEFRKLLKINSGARLGLSATPQRAGDQEGTKAIFNYFSGVIPPPFTLNDAINSGSLTPYIYHVHELTLTDEEQTSWGDFTKRIQRLYARLLNSKSTDFLIEERIRRLLIARSSIVKRASKKVPLSKQIISQHYESGQRWIVYCDSIDQLNEVVQVLRLSGFEDVFEYHYKMPGNRRETLKRFETSGGIIVSIKCLDEGVDIPSVTHALILASSKNPREFIQRRGRILRLSPGKNISFLHDCIVVPQQNFGKKLPTGTAILEGELARAIEFSKNAINPNSSTNIRLIAHKFNIDLTKLLTEGYEYEEDST